MRAGLSILLQKAGVPESALKKVVIAGAFGSYISVQSAVTIGMFPKLPLERFVQVGNAAGMGARMALISRGAPARRPHRRPGRIRGADQHARVYRRVRPGHVPFVRVKFYFLYDS